MIGRVKAGGLTLRAVEEELKTRLADGYPEASPGDRDDRNLSQPAHSGARRSPGPRRVPADRRHERSSPRWRAPVRRHRRRATRSRSSGRPRQESGGDKADKDESTTPQIIKVDLAALQTGNPALNIQLFDGDTVTVAKARSVFVTGQVRSPGAYAVEDGTTVLQVLSLAGGMTDRGADGRIKIQRTVNGKQTEIKAKTTDVVKPGDTIIVPEQVLLTDTSMNTPARAAHARVGPSAIRRPNNDT